MRIFIIAALLIAFAVVSVLAFRYVYTLLNIVSRLNDVNGHGRGWMVVSVVIGSVALALWAALLVFIYREVKA